MQWPYRGLHLWVGRHSGMGEADDGAIDCEYTHAKRDLRNQRHDTCGINSRVMVVSMGIFPPTPKPTKAVSTRKVL